MAFLGIKTPCLIPCFPPFTFGCRDENGDLPCQEEYYAHRQSQTQQRQEGRTTRRTIEEETDVVKSFGNDYVDALDAATTGDSNRSSAAEDIGALGDVAGEITSVLAMTGALDALFGGGDDEESTGGAAPNQLPGGIQLTTNAIIFGGLGIGLLLLSQRR